MIKPLWRHDCDQCVLLGQTGTKDVYFCMGEESLVLRYSSDGPDYFSFPLFIARSIMTRNKEWEVPVALADAFLAGRGSVTAEIKGISGVAG